MGADNIDICVAMPIMTIQVSRLNERPTTEILGTSPEVDGAR